jgi:hypothetical protein
MTKARDISKLLSTANGKIAGSNLDVSFENISDTGTEGTKVASGTTAQRGSTTGQWRFNSTTGLFEGKNATGFVAIEPTPAVSSVDVSQIQADAGGNQTVVVTGTDFSSGGTITFVGLSAEFNASTTTFNSSTQVTAVAPKASFLNAQEPYKVKFTSSTGKSGITPNGVINVDSSPVWNTAAGALGNIFDDSSASTVHATLSATDPDGETVAYSETGATNLSGAGLSLNSSNGQITGDPNNVSSDTTVSFTGRATANSQSTDRSFNIVVKQGLLQTGLIGHYSFKSGDSYSGSGSTVTNLYTGSGALGSGTLYNSPVYDSTNGAMKFNESGSSNHHILRIPNSTSRTALSMQILMDFTAENNGGGRSYIMDARQSGTGSDVYWIMDSDGNGSQQLTMNNGNGEVFGNAGHSLVSYGYRVQTMIFGSGFVRWRHHQQDGTDANYIVDNPSMTANSGNYDIMGIEPNDSSNNYYARGNIKAILIYGAKLTEAQADSNASILWSNNG